MSLASESKFLLECFIQKQSFLSCLTPSIPFRLFRSSALYNQLSKPKTCLPLNRFTDPLALSRSSSYISVWSQSHLQFLQLLNRTRSIQMEKLILKNPFKTQKLIKDCIEQGLNTMLVDDFEQLWKIHQCRFINNSLCLQQIPIKFVWMVSDSEKDLKQIQTLKNYNIKLTGLFFDQAQTKKVTDVKKFIEKANGGLSEKRRIKTVYLESESDQFDQTQEAYQNDEFFVRNKIEIILERTDFKMVNEYWIAARVIGESKQKELIVSQQAYNYISPEKVRKGKMIQNEGKNWVLSSINYFPEMKVMEEHQRKGYIMQMN